jgi:ParB family chromosome partitioning protein
VHVFRGAGTHLVGNGDSARLRPGAIRVLRQSSPLPRASFLASVPKIRASALSRAASPAKTPGTDFSGSAGGGTGKVARGSSGEWAGLSFRSNLKENLMSSKNQESSVQMLPLNQLKKSSRNVRQVAHDKAHIEALAASIAAQGQIQNLVVETEKDGEGRPTGSYLVNVGEGRRQAFLLRVKRKEIKATEPVRCVVDDTHDARSLSLAENDIRANMHPADQFEAFKRLIDSGLSAETVAAQFGVSSLVVTRRLKLANVAPMFLGLYREDKVTLEQLMALALTDDHDRQRKVWSDLPVYRRTPDGLRQALTAAEIATGSAVAKFVSLKAYEKAGGAIRRDLFSDQQDEGFVLDTELLWKLANKKLERQATKLKGEGWAWVEIMPELDYSALSAFGRVSSISREATTTEKEELERLNLQLDETRQQLAEAEDEDERIDFLEQLEEEIGDKIEAIEEGMQVSDPEQRAVAGAVVCIDRSGKAKLETGLLRAEDARKFQKSQRAASREASSEPRVHSAALARRLTAHWTLALCATVAQRPDVALLALVHRLAVLTFFDIARWNKKGIQVDTRRTDFRVYGEDLVNSMAQQAMTEMEQAWRARLPQDVAQLFGWLAVQEQSVVLDLCAYCVATTLDGVSADEGGDDLSVVANAAGLDMRHWWAPTADHYLKSVPKARIFEALKEAGAAPDATLNQLKKSDLAAAAERQLAGTGWLPGLLRPAAA